MSSGGAGSQVRDLVDVIVQSIGIMAAEHMKVARNDADVLIAPALQAVGRMDFAQKAVCLRAGIRATRQAMPAIREKMAAWQKHHQRWWERFMPNPVRS